ncbi:Geraniol dehydrogenase (NADP(+)) [Bertholletia excelsa]
MSLESGKGECLGWAAKDTSGVLLSRSAAEQGVGSEDVSMTITHCGVCYADVLLTWNLLGRSRYPVVPGHKIVGVVREVGCNVKGFKVGEHVGVGTYVNSCRDRECCKDRMEVYSPQAVFPYNHADVDGSFTRGGYSTYTVVHQRHCFKIPENYPPGLAAPLLLCAGVTVYAPMVRHRMNQPGKSLGVIGLGGLGHLAVKFGKAFGLKVTVLSTSKSKGDEALNLLGADQFAVSSDPKQMMAQNKSLDFIVDTSSGDHPFDPYTSLLKTGGVFVLVGAPSAVKLSPLSLISGMKTFSGSASGGTKETQKVLDFCAANKIYPQVEVIPIQCVNEAPERVVKRDVNYRFVIDIENSLK